MITLLTFAPAFGLPAASPFCVKAIWLLNQSGQPWQRRDTADPRPMPKGKLPVIEVDGQRIPDSDNIRAYLEGLGADFERGLGPKDRAHARALVRMAEEHLYFHLVAERWLTPSVWPAVRDTFFGQIPRPLRNLATRGLRKSIQQGLNMQGVGRLDPQERLERIEPDLAALADQLAGQAFLFGDHATAADASVAPMLAAMRATPGDTPLRRRILGDAKLGSYIDRFDASLGTAEPDQEAA